MRNHNRRHLRASWIESACPSSCVYLRYIGNSHIRLVNGCEKFLPSSLSGSCLKNKNSAYLIYGPYAGSFWQTLTSTRAPLSFRSPALLVNLPAIQSTPANPLICFLSPFPPSGRLMVSLKNARIGSTKVVRCLREIRSGGGN